MSIQRINGAKANEDGFPRSANPVSYVGADGLFSSKQAALRDEWFAGWDEQQKVREEWEESHA